MTEDLIGNIIFEILVHVNLPQGGLQLYVSSDPDRARGAADPSSSHSVAGTVDGPVAHAGGTSLEPNVANGSLIHAGTPVSFQTKASNLA